MAEGIELGFRRRVQMAITVMALCIPQSSKICITVGMLTFVWFETHVVRPEGEGCRLHRRSVGHVDGREGSGALSWSSVNGAS